MESDFAFIVNFTNLLTKLLLKQTIYLLANYRQVEVFGFLDAWVVYDLRRFQDLLPKKTVSLK